MQETCCQGQHTYLHAQQLLTHLGRHPKGARFRRLSQELQLHAASQRGPIVWRMQPLFETKAALDGHTEAARAVTALLSTGVSGSAFAGLGPVVAKVHALYSGPDMPPISFIRHARVRVWCCLPTKGTRKHRLNRHGPCRDFRVPQEAGNADYGILHVLYRCVRR